LEALTVVSNLHYATRSIYPALMHFPAAPQHLACARQPEVADLVHQT
jgi:hypothetical protein